MPISAWRDELEWETSEMTVGSRSEVRGFWNFEPRTSVFGFNLRTSAFSIRTLARLARSGLAMTYRLC
jgi:hypothetical protein